MDPGCPTAPWSAVTSAQANAALAGVLAGFMFGGIVLLLGQRPTPRRLQAMSLMLAAFVVLGLDAYLFGLVTGETAALCRRQWTEAMIAAGLLGVGVVAIMCALGLLLNSYIGPEERTPAAAPGAQAEPAGEPDLAGLDEPAELLRLLTRGLMYGVVLLVVFLLTVTAEDYLNAVFSFHPPRWLADLVYGYALLPAAGLAVTYRAKHPARDPGRGRAGAGSQPGRAAITGRLLTVATITAAAYAVLGTILASLAASFPAGDWNPMRTWVAAGITAVSLLAPVPIFVAMASAVPSMLTDRGPQAGTRQASSNAVDQAE